MAASNISAISKDADSAHSDRSPKLRLDIYGLVIVALSTIMLLSLVSYHPSDFNGTVVLRSTNLIGPVGSYMASFFIAGLGLASFLVAFAFLLTGWAILTRKQLRLGAKEALAAVGSILALAIFVHIASRGGQVWEQSPGGVIGEYGGEILRAFFSTIGALILTLTSLILCALVLTRKSLAEAQRWLRHSVPRIGRSLLAGPSWVLARVGSLWSRLRRRQIAASQEAEPFSAVATTASGSPNARPKASEPPLRLVNPAGEAPGEPRIVRRGKISQDDERTVVDPPHERLDVSVAGRDSARRDDVTPVTRRRDASPRDENATPPDAVTPITRTNNPTPAEKPEPLRRERAPIVETAPVDDDDFELEIDGDEGDAESPAAGDDADGGPRIVESAAMRKAGNLELVAPQQQPLFEERRKRPYEPFPLGLLNYEPPKLVDLDRESLRQNAQRLEETLKNYGVKGKVVEIHPGPVVTTYEYLPDPGVKISKIANLSDDLTMALAAYSVRIVAPIPGKGVVGIEVPNNERETVFLKEIFGSKEYARSKSKLTVALGKDIVGNPVVGNLAKMPHLLVAGATGSGKSVGINGVICSLLYNAGPDEVKLILVDPKMLELSVYAEIPHLLLPVVTDPKKANLALKWAVEEMERRYKNLAKLGVRNIANYNKKLDEMDEELAAETGHASLPYIVVIIDELADLMMVASKEVETSIARLAQMARAAGIHLILATQRPSVDVITGLIKANFPSRMSFQVASKIDSRTILDTQGAEKLLGMGDMLFLPPGTSRLTRVHGAFVSDDEVKRIADFARSQGEPEYQFEILDRDEENGSQEEIEYDPLYDQAVAIVAETRQASISYLQRRLKVGYNRAARMIEVMEIEGIVGASDGVKPRKVLVPSPSSIE
ncbi:MAG: DNA translocase FtsK [Myxococcales bacterium]|nr:DNA translocase FtsK [Myxococcales bacterium]